MRQFLFAFVLATSVGFGVQCLAQKQLIVNPFVTSHVPMEDVELEEEFHIGPEINKAYEAASEMESVTQTVVRHKIPFVFHEDGLYLAPVYDGVRGNVRKITVTVNRPAATSENWAEN